MPLKTKALKTALQNFFKDNKVELNSHKKEL